MPSNLSTSELILTPLNFVLEIERSFVAIKYLMQSAVSPPPFPSSSTSSLSTSPGRFGSCCSEGNVFNYCSGGLVNSWNSPLPARASRGEGNVFLGALTQGGARASLTLGYYLVIPAGFQFGSKFAIHDCQIS